MHGTNARRHTTTQQTHFFGVGGGIDFGQRNFIAHGVFAEGAATHVMKNRLTLVGKTRGAIGHQPLALCGAYFLAQIGFAREAKLAFAALGGVERNDMIARLQAGDALTDLDHHARTLMPQHGWENALRVIATQGECIGMAHAGVADLDQYLALFGRGHVDLNDLQGLACGKGHCGS